MIFGWESTEGERLLRLRERLMSRCYFAQELSCVMERLYDARAPAIRAFLRRFAGTKDSLHTRELSSLSKATRPGYESSQAVTRIFDKTPPPRHPKKLRRLTLEVDAARPVVLLEVLAQLQAVFGGIQIPLVQPEREEVLRVKPVLRYILEDVVLRALPA